MTEEQFAVFEGWWSVHSGMDWFTLLGSEMRFIQGISSTPVATTGLWSVNGVLETKP